MQVKTMEGLVGARTNMNLVNTPMRVYKEARRRGDTAAMERAMGYVSDFEGKAQEYQSKVKEGMKEEAEQAREKGKAQQEEAIEKRREDQKEPEVETEKNQEEKEETNKSKEPVTYTKTGEISRMEQVSNISVSI